MKLLLPLLSLALTGVTMTSCVVSGYPDGSYPVSRVGVGYGYYDTLPSTYVGDAYFLSGRYYYGGRYETGRYYYQGRSYNDRYYHSGHYYYGGRHEHHGSSDHIRYDRYDRH